MSAHEDAVKAAAEALSEYYEGDGWGYFGGAAEAAVDAAAPILLAAERARIAAAIRDHEGWADYRHDGLADAARIAETAPDVPMSPIKGHAETAPGEGP